MGLPATAGEHLLSLGIEHRVQSCQGADAGWEQSPRRLGPALLPPPWKRVLGPLGEHAGTPHLGATPYAPASKKLSYVPWGWWGLALE